jgi:Holliday junction resolvase-like predicted endonuclease
MALLAESLVEEWLNRDGYFTIRGLKHGVGEMDLLAIRPEPEGKIVGMHVEVQGFAGSPYHNLKGGYPAGWRGRLIK